MNEKEMFRKMLHKVNKDRKGEFFVNHIQRHLKKDEKVICKICNKDVDTIFTEELERFIKHLNTELMRT